MADGLPVRLTTATMIKHKKETLYVPALILLDKMKILAGLFSASFAYGTTETYSTETNEATTYYYRITYPTDTSTDTSTSTSTLGSSWSPLKCGECGCCCRPEHRPYCENGVNLPKGNLFNLIIRRRN